MKKETLNRGDLMIGNDSTLLKKGEKRDVFINKIKNTNKKSLNRRDLKLGSDSNKKTKMLAPLCSHYLLFLGI